MTLTAGTYSVGAISLSGNASLNIDDSNGPVIIYATGSVSLSGNGVSTTSSDSTQFILYQIGGADVA